jgi:hypothetical protein
MLKVAGTMSVPNLSDSDVGFLPSFLSILSYQHPETRIFQSRHTHHRQTCDIITRPIIWISILCLATAVLFPIPMCSIDSHKTLPLRLQHVLSRIIKPAINEVSMEAIPIANLSVSVHPIIQHLPKAAGLDDLPLHMPA